MSPARTSLALGLLGLVPFAGFVIAAWLAPNIGLRYTLLEAEIAWAAIILSFMAGARWAFTLAHASPQSPSLRALVFGLVPAISLAATVLTKGWALALLATGFVGLFAAELAPDIRREAPTWYPVLRLYLTIGALACLLGAAVL